jgi:hypothetical protein
MSKVEAFWQPATSDDVAKIANTRKPISARVRDEETEAWREDLISGWKLSRSLPGAVWIDADGVHWKHCQVYREPSWYANKPDPGPEHRLLGKFPDEAVRGGDFIRGFDGNWTELRNGCNPKQAEDLWYRRRIEPVEPVKAISMSDFEAICNGELVKGYAYKLPNGQTITITAKGFEVTQ